MNEVALSSDLNVITAEINSYKQVAGQSIFEIGKRLKHIKENDLVHGEWTNYCTKTLDMTIGYANRYIKVYEEFSDSNMYTSIGLNKLYQIATMPEEERKKKHTLPSGETKKVDEMTSRELEEVKRQLKLEQKERERLERENEKLASQEPIIQEKEVIPDHVKKEMLNREEKLIETTNKLDDLQSKLDMLSRQNSYMDDEERKEKEIKALQYEANKTVLTTKLKMDEFLKDVAITAFRRGAIASSSEGTRENLRQGIEELKNFIKEMEMALDGRIEA